MVKQKPSSIIETEQGERVGNVALAIVAIKNIPDLIDDIIDEMDPKVEREVIQRYMCQPPLFDQEPNSENYISKAMHVNRKIIKKIIERFKKLVWRNINGKDTCNN